jgi:hypothetical protein
MLSWGWPPPPPRASTQLVVPGIKEPSGGKKNRRFGGGEEKLTWHGGTHELGRRIGKLLEQIVFWDENIFTPS